ncbi:MAG: hypothetical protein JWR87_3774 [Segetibacter sp.]|jgi:hypothetical protein|nr:hypothetical protein [Segetibacter sp.]
MVFDAENKVVTELHYFLHFFLKLKPVIQSVLYCGNCY